MNSASNPGLSKTNRLLLFCLAGLIFYLNRSKLHSYMLLHVHLRHIYLGLAFSTFFLFVIFTIERKILHNERELCVVRNFLFHTIQ